MYTRLLLSLLLGLALSSEASAQKRKSLTTVGPTAKMAVEGSSSRRTTTSSVLFADHQAFVAPDPLAQTPAALFAGNGVDLYVHHYDYTDQWLAERPSIWREDRFAGIDPSDFDGAASFVEVFIDDWQFATYRSFSFHVLADDVVGLEIKSRFSL